MVSEHIEENITTNKLNDICHNYITKVLKAYPATLNYNGFPKSICTSVNNEVCHGVPKNKILKSGDILNIDVTILKDGYHGDTSKMFTIGYISEQSNDMINIAKECLYKAIKKLQPGVYLNIIGQTIENHAKKHNYSIIKEYCGHGIGKYLHEDPCILHYKNNDQKIKLTKGMIFTIEPIISAGTNKVKTLKDGWTVLTLDNSLSAQWEHTILITENGHEILTQRDEEII